MNGNGSTYRPQDSEAFVDDLPVVALRIDNDRNTFLSVFSVVLAKCNGPFLGGKNISGSSGSDDIE